MNRETFFAAMRRDIAGGSLTRGQVCGTEAILDHVAAHCAGLDRRFLAYMLATAWHESAATMQPVRETLSRSDDGAIAILRKAFVAGRLPWVKKPYWERDRDGKSWLGRGLVQLTHKANYARIGRAIGVDLLAAPARAMEMDVAVTILATGMIEGLFTGNKLADYFCGEKADWENARRIITGPESMETVANYGRCFYAALRESGED
jgi:predicted chitinase